MTSKRYMVQFMFIDRWLPSCGPKPGEATLFKSLHGARQRAKFYATAEGVRIVDAATLEVIKCERVKEGA